MNFSIAAEYHPGEDIEDCIGIAFAGGPEPADEEKAVVRDAIDDARGYFGDVDLYVNVSVTNETKVTSAKLAEARETPRTFEKDIPATEEIPDPGVGAIVLTTESKEEAKEAKEDPISLSLPKETVKEDS